MSPHHKRIAAVSRTRDKGPSLTSNSRSRPGPASVARKSGTLTAKSPQGSRQKKLERARSLLKDAQYPSDEVIESVARLLEKNWRRLRQGE